MGIDSKFIIGEFTFLQVFVYKISHKLHKSMDFEYSLLHELFFAIK